ncbi:MAG: TIGR03790 family protein [Phycisphaerales bacterium]|nr:TIGR03790 family protein [Phycisphaerales bacterium]
MQTHKTVLAVLWLLAAPVGLAGLTADQLLLVVNENVPVGIDLARHYAVQRGVPEAQILPLALPTGEEMSPDEYERLLADPIRLFLRGVPHVRCIVTLPGVPIRIAARTASPELDAELRLILRQLGQIEPKLSAAALEAERLAKQADPSFVPQRGDGVEGTMARIRHAALHTANTAGTVPAERRAELDRQWQRISRMLEEPVAESEPPSTKASTEPAAFSEGYSIGCEASRRQSRELARRLGLARYAQMLDAQRDFLAGEQADAAVDNELAAVGWGLYRRARWQGNPLHLSASGTAARQTMMVSRLDGPSPEVVRRMINDSLAVERAGLRGVIVLDSWNKPLKKPDGSIDGYGRYDQTLRELRDILAGQSAMPVVFEATDQLVAQNSHADIALYCGWYDPGRVQLPGTFARGAVGFHVASYTAVSLRASGGGLWAPELLSAGVCATVGPVSEPYLSAFPDAHEFFALLLSGRLTLAECYWATCPKISWKMMLLGDPLYRPFAVNPPLSPDQLPERLRLSLENPAEGRK